MEKLLALMLAVALALSLAACGGGAGDNSTPSTGGGDTTSTDTPGGGSNNTPEKTIMTKEEMLEEAEVADLYDMHNACFENVLDGVVNKQGAKWQYNGFEQRQRKKRRF